jgi:hypothetical protein
MLTLFCEISIAASRIWLAAETSNDGEFYHVNDSEFIVYCDECVPDSLEPGDLLARTWNFGIFIGLIAEPTFSRAALYEIAEVIAEVQND